MIESVTSLSSEKHGNYYGEDVLDRWDTKIQAVKGSGAQGPEVTSAEAPVEDDEWD